MKKRQLLSLALSFIMPAIATAQSYLFSPKGIAEIHITLLNGKTIDDIKRDEVNFEAEKLEATMQIKNSDRSTYNESELYNGKILIKGRGNTTWGRPKKPYSIDLIDTEGEDNPSALLGMPADEEWALIAFWNDRSKLRIPLAYYLGSVMNGLAYSPRYKYVEVYLNNDYRGLYLLCEKIKRSKDRVNVAKLKPESENISGGYIVEAIPTGRVKEKEKNTEFQTGTRNINFIFKYPKAKNATPEQVTWIKDYISEFESVLYGNNFKDVTNGYMKYIDVNSFIDWNILHDLSKGVDNLFHASVFVQKEQDGLLGMSAPWDFDISFGNVNGQSYYENELWIKKTHWFNRLFQDSRFAEQVVQRFEELSPLFDQIPEILATNYLQLEESGCLERDNTKWPQILRDYKDKEERTTPTTVKGHVRWLNEWIESRRACISIELGLSETGKANRLKQTRPVIRVMNPEAFERGEASDVKILPGYTYVWNGENEQTTENYRIDTDGEYYVQLKDANGNLSLPSKVISRGDAYKKEFYPSATLQHTAEKLFLTVNTRNNKLTISYPSENEHLLDICIYDLQGKSVKRKQIQTTCGLNIYEIDLNGIIPGNYIVQCKSGQQAISHKIIIH
ncbi:CotH kinase family protein [Coprobacter sp.]